jgi:hypothetical protein
MAGTPKYHGCRPVEEVADRAEQLAWRSRVADASTLLGQLAGRDLRAAFMADKVNLHAEQRVREACKRRNVLQLRRTGRSIVRVQGMALRVCGASRPMALG